MRNNHCIYCLYNFYHHFLSLFMKILKVNDTHGISFAIFIGKTTFVTSCLLSRALFFSRKGCTLMVEDSYL